MSTLLLGVALTFASVDGKDLALNVALTAPATVAISYDDVTATSSIARRHHRFAPLPAAKDVPHEYSVTVAGEAPRKFTVRPLLGGPNGDELRIAVYGASRGSAAAHALVLEQIVAHAPNVIIHTGDLVQDAADAAGWRAHATATQGLWSTAPVVFAIGDREVAPAPGVSRERGVQSALQHYPPPFDLVQRAHGTSHVAFHVRVGSTLLVALDTNASLGANEPQLRYLKQILADHADAAVKLVAIHRGPVSSGPRGAHPNAAALIAAVRSATVTAVLSAHEHTYERLADSSVTYLVSGGGGAPLDRQLERRPESIVFASTYNWVLIRVRDGVATFETYGAHGALLDRGALKPTGSGRPRTGPPFRLFFGVAIVSLAFAYVLSRVIRGAG